jgi:hypothetical protein
LKKIKYAHGTHAEIIICALKKMKEANNKLASILAKRCMVIHQPDHQHQFAAVMHWCRPDGIAPHPDSDEVPDQHESAGVDVPSQHQAE